MSSPFYREGNYRLRVTKQALGVSSKSETPQFVLTAKVIGEYDGDNLENVTQEYERTIFMYLTENAMPYVIEQLAILGFGGTSFKQLNPEAPGAVNFVGTEFDGFCKHETYQNSPREKWGMSLGKSTMDVKPLESSKVRDLDALFGKQLASISGTRAGHAGGGAATDRATVSDDDLPF